MQGLFLPSGPLPSLFFMPFLIPSHLSCMSPNASVIEAFRGATCYSSALSDPLTSPSSCIFCYHCRSLHLYCLPSFKCTLNGKRGTSQFCSPSYPGILKYLLNDWMKSGRNWLGACQWPTGRSGLGSHGKHVASSMITSGKRRGGKLRDKLERRKWGKNK